MTDSRSAPRHSGSQLRTGSVNASRRLVDGTHHERGRRDHLRQRREIEDRVGRRLRRIGFVRERAERAAPDGAVRPADFSHRAGKRAIEDTMEQDLRGSIEGVRHPRGGASRTTMPRRARSCRPSRRARTTSRRRHSSTRHTSRPECRRSCPQSIAADPTRRVSTPVRNAPSTGPAAKDSTSRPASSTDRSIHCAPSATPIWTMPQPIVACRDSRIRRPHRRPAGRTSRRSR